MTNENHQKRANGPLKACAKQLPRKKRKTRARWGTTYLRALIVSKNALKAPTEEAQKKNRKGKSRGGFLRNDPGRWPSSADLTEAHAS